MNAPATETALSFAEVPLAQITLSTTHVQAARRKRYSESALEELAASIRAQGVLQPILVRPHETAYPGAEIQPPNGYQIVAGERRFLGAQRAGLEHVPVIVRELDDAQVLEAQLIENVQREDIDPLSEAEGLQELMELKRITADQVGELVGKSRSAIYARLKLLQLIPAAREAVETGKLDASRGLLVARIVEPKQQAQALQLALETDWKGRPVHSYRDLLQELARKGAQISLSTAPFDPADATLLPDMGACTTCPHRTGNAPAGIAADDPDVCTNSMCHKLKLKAHARRVAEAAQAKGKEVIKGADAKAIAPSKAVLVGYVDLDQPCIDDGFIERAPEPTGNEEADDAAEEAWQQRADAWQPRTYRQLLDAGVIETTLIEDPKTKQIRELVPVDLARKALKQRDIELSKHVGKEPPKPSRGYDHSKWQEEQRKRNAEIEARRAYHRRILAAIHPKALGPLEHAEIVAIARGYADHWSTLERLKDFYSADDLKAIGGLKAPELGRFIRLARVADEIGYDTPRGLLELAKRYGVDLKAIKAELERPAPEKSKEKPKTRPAKAKPTKKAVAKKPAAKRGKGKK